MTDLTTDPVITLHRVGGNGGTTHQRVSGVLHSAYLKVAAQRGDADYAWSGLARDGQVMTVDWIPNPGRPGCDIIALETIWGDPQ